MWSISLLLRLSLSLSLFVDYHFYYYYYYYCGHQRHPYWLGLWTASDMLGYESDMHVCMRMRMNDMMNMRMCRPSFV